MKTRLARLLLTLLSLLVLVVSASAAEFRSEKHVIGAKAAYVIFPGQAGRQIVLRSLDITSNHADAKYKIATGDTRTAIAAAYISGDGTLPVASTNGFGVGEGDIVVQRRGGSGVTTAYGYDGVMETGGVKQLIVVDAQNEPPDIAQVGDIVWWCSNTMTNALGSGTLRLNGDLIAAAPGAAMYIRAWTVSGSESAINSCTVEYTRFP